MSWKVKSLQDVCEKITDGTHQTPTYFPDGIVFLSSKNVTTGKIDWENIKYIDEAQHLELHKRVAPKIGDILLAKNGTTGVAAIVDRDIVFDIYVSLAWLRPKGEITSEYLLQFINSPLAKKQFNSRLKGIGVPNLHLKEIKEVKIPIPPLSEQQAIVEKLDAAFALIDQAKANIEKNIQNAKELFQSKLNQIFSQKGEGWEEKKFEEICILQRGFDLPAQSRNKGSFPLVSSNGTTDYISDFKVKGPGVTTGRSGTIGKVHYISEDFWPLNTSLYIKDFRGNFEKYIFYFLNSIDILKFASGAGVPTLNRNNLHSEIFFFHNSLETQQQIVLQLDALSQQTNLLQEKYRQKLQNLEELRKSILEKAFKGELVQMSESQISTD